jgi:drug/metabolite transporter (DMT)-like permease
MRWFYRIERDDQMDQTDKQRSISDYGLIALTGFLLGIPYALTKISQTTIPPLTGVAARVALAAIVLWMIVFASNIKLSSLRGRLSHLLLQGFLSSVIPYTLIAYGQLSVNSALAAILNSTTPLFVCLTSLFWTRHEALNFNRLFGVSAGLAGVVMIAGMNSFHGLDKNMLGETAIILATTSSAIAAVQGRRLNDIPPELAAAGTLTSGALILIPLCFIVEAPFESAPSSSSIVALLINAFFATALRSVIFFHLIRTIGSMGTTSAGYLKPAVGILMGYTLMGESLTWTALAGLLAIFVGVATINQKQPMNLPQFSIWRLAARISPTIR